MVTSRAGRVLLAGAAVAPVVTGEHWTAAETAPGWDLRTAADLFSALDVLAEFSPDALVVSFTGPAVAVMEFLAEARRHDPFMVRLVLVEDSRAGDAVSFLGPHHLFATYPDAGEVPVAHVREALAAMVAARDTVLAPGLPERLAGGDVPRQPAVHAEILDATSRPDATIADIVAVIEHDVSTVSEILRVVNSAYFGLPTIVDSIERAVTLIGLEMVEALAVAGAVFGQYSDVPGRLDLLEVARRSVGVASTARRIAQHQRWTAEVRSSLFVAGLLHQVGLLVMTRADPTAPDRLDALVAAGSRDVDAVDAAEVEVFGCTVADASAAILHAWGFAPQVVMLLAALRRRGGPRCHRSPAAQCLTAARHLDLTGSLAGFDARDSWLTPSRLQEWEKAAQLRAAASR